MMEGYRVELEDDLTRYHPSLAPGSVGTTVGQQGMWSRNSDRFITVQFEKNRLDVLWKGLKILENPDGTPFVNPGGKGKDHAPASDYKES